MNASRGDGAKHVRAIFSLPAGLLTQTQLQAARTHGGNKSGFVADALRNYLDLLKKASHTRKLREAYAASAHRSLAVSQQWQSIDDELWKKLDSTKSSL